MWENRIILPSYVSSEGRNWKGWWWSVCAWLCWKERLWNIGKRREGEMAVGFIHTCLHTVYFHLRVLYAHAFACTEYLHMYADVCVCVWYCTCGFQLLVLAGCCFEIFFRPFYRDQNRGKTTTAAPNRLAPTITATNYGCLTWSSHYV